MAEKCYQGTSVPQKIVEPCDGDYKSTSCILSPNALIYLGLPQGASQTQINNALLLALTNKDQQIAALQTIIAPTILTGSATLDFPATEPGNSSELTFTVTGASQGDVIALGTPNVATAEDSCFTARVSSDNTVTVKLNNYSNVVLNPQSALFKVKIFK